MAESQKEAASTSKSQKKVSILDDEFGINFLGSWKSMAVAKDDGLDFGAEVAPKGKKNAFDFDKLDMDFSLDGDFGSKLSSFKVDMVDLDFSSPPKKPAKPKEKSAKETNHGGKQDRFSFSFNFDELDNFDLDSSLMKTEKKSDKVPDDKHIGSPGNLEKNQSPRRNLVTSADAPEDGPTNKLPEPERLATSKVDPLIGKNDTSLSVSTDLGSLNASHDGMRTIPEKEIMSCTKETSGHSEQSERMVSTEPNPQETIQDSSMRSVSNDDSIQDVPELQVEVCSSATEVISNQEEEQDINGKKLCNMECSPTSRSPHRTHNEFTNKLENQTSVATGDINMDGSMQGDTHTEDASVAIATVDMLSTTTTHENKSTCNLPVAPLHSDPKSHKLLPMELKDTGNMQSKPLDQSEGNGSELNTPEISNKIKPVVNENRHLSPADPRQECNAFYAQSGSKKFDYSKSHVRAAMEGVPAGLESDKDNVIHNLTASENKSHKLLPTILMKPDSTQSKPLSQSGAKESQLNTAAIPKKINHLLNKIEIAHSNHTDARKEINVSDVQAGSQKIDSSNLHDRAVTKGVPDELGSNKDNKVNKLSASFKVHSAGLMEQKFETKTFKGLNSRLHVSSIPAIQNLKSTSVEGNKLSPLEAGKKAFNVTSAKLSRPATPKTLLQSNLQTEAKSLQRLDRKAVMPISPAAKLGHAGTPTMKRKISEVPKEYPVNPVKRITGSPLEERDSPTTYENADNKRVRNNENLLGSCYFSPTSDIHRDASMKEFEVPLLMEDDGIVEKAEACAKELDNICNILKKKHEEAKEILVRAVVNNNNLLMLNHPVHEEKIQMVHRLASRLSRELQI